MAVIAKLRFLLPPFRSGIIANQVALQSRTHAGSPPLKPLLRSEVVKGSNPAFLRTSADPLGRRTNHFVHKHNFSSPREAEKFVKHLRPSEVENLKFELEKRGNTEGGGNSDQVSTDELKAVFWFNFVPFIAFGFLDNAIMIVAGEFIEINIGMKLGISTMAAAAWGNIISDVAGIGLAGYVEMAASKLGLRVPDLTARQTCLTSTRVAANLGKGIGIIIGCIFGMIPLLFMKEKLEEES